jgi:hypothetical protein
MMIAHTSVVFMNQQAHCCTKLTQLPTKVAQSATNPTLDLLVPWVDKVLELDPTVLTLTVIFVDKLVF